MNRIQWLCSVLLATSVPVFADDKAILPPPVVAIVQSIDAGKGLILVRTSHSKFVSESRFESRERIIDGQKVTEEVPVTVVRLVIEQQTLAWSAKKGKAINTKGKSLSIEDLSNRLKKDDAVMLAVGDRIDSALVSVLREDVVILLSTPATSILPPLPLPAPPVPAKRAPLNENDLSDTELTVIELVNSEREKDLRWHPWKRIRCW